MMNSKCLIRLCAYEIYLSRISVSDFLMFNIVENTALKDVLPTTIKGALGHETDWEYID